MAKKSLFAHLQHTAASQTAYGVDPLAPKPGTSSALSSTVCDGCGAPRSLAEGLLKCAYCGFEYMDSNVNTHALLNNPLLSHDD